ncbi:MAG: ABC transporter ATP-binding protein [Desulfobulbus sp.]
MTDNKEQRRSVPIMSGMPGPGGRGMAHGQANERAKDTRGAVRRLLSYFKSYRLLLTLLFLLALAATVLALLTPYLIGKAVDQLVHGNLSMLVRIVWLILAVNVLTMVAGLGQGMMMATLSQRAMRELRGDLFRHLQKLSLRFFDSQSQGDLMSRLTNDMDMISQVVTNNIADLITGLLTIIGILLIMFFLSPWLALGSMIAFPLMLGLVIMVGRRTKSSFAHLQARMGRLNSVLEETYSGQRVVMAFGQEENVLAQFDRVNDEVRDAGIKAMTMALLVMPMMGILSNLNIAILCGLGGWLAIQGMVTIGTIAAFITYSRRFAEPLRQLGNLYNQVQGALAGAERIFALLDTAPDQVDGSTGSELRDVQGQVVFNNLTFAYSPGIPVLKNVSLNARPGQRIALVGHTGAGKTTLVNLLCRFYDFTEGSIEIDGVDIRTISPDSLRQKVGVVLQQSFLFSESVLENIRYGRLEASEQEVQAVARLAGADGFIRRLPDGYRTILSERGANLSEGQRQLLTIARAILADPAILILDEATSSVDTRTEIKIQKALNELMQGRTSFVIAHRLSTIINADQIVVIDRGKVVESGTHSQLLAGQGIYHRLYASQFRIA